MSENKMMNKLEVEIVDIFVEEDWKEDKGAIVDANTLSRTVTFWLSARKKFKGGGQKTIYHCFKQ